MKKNFIINLASAVILLLIYSCSDNFFGVYGSGSIVSEERPVSGFSNIELDMAAKVEVTKDSIFRVEVSDHENLVPHIATITRGGTLIIRHDPRSLNFNNSSATVRIFMPALNALEVNGSGNISLLSGFDQLQSVSISGSGEVSAMETFNADKLFLDISGSGKLSAAGTAGQVNLDISGSGNIYCYGLEAQEVTCNISGSGNAFINVSRSLKGSISGSGTITYAGQPQISVDISGSGKIKSR